MRLFSALFAVLWLDERLRQAKVSAFGPGKPGWAEYELGRSALQRADALRFASPIANPAVLLYRAAVRLFAGARVAYEASTSLPEHSAQVAELLGEQGESLLARLDARDLRSVGVQLRRVALELLEPLARDNARVRRVQLARWSRVGVLAALALAGLVVALHHPNLALGRSVTVAAADADYPPSQLVDGKQRNLGFHSSGAAPHVVSIDLGSVRVVSKVVVFNREDCCQERAVPLRLELGDGQTFKRVAERDTLFNVWRASFPAERARFVRLISTNSAPFHLAEVEVY